jgi:ATP dependent DNA ligase domain
MAARAPPRPGLPGGLVAPMLATAGSVPTSAGWACEIKFDGVRAISYVTGGGVRLYSRNDRDITASYPDVAAVLVEDGLVLDGELVALDSHGRPDFELLQHRMHVQRPTRTGPPRCRCSTSCSTSTATAVPQRWSCLTPSDPHRVGVGAARAAGAWELHRRLW